MTAPFDPSQTHQAVAIPAALADVSFPPVPRERSAPVRRSAYRAGLKRAFDIFVVLLAAPAVVTFVAMLALIVAFGGGNPFYSQIRVGMHGRHYRMWKLRTMVVDADARLEAYLAAHPEARSEWDRTQKLRYDPRITRWPRLAQIVLR